MPKSCGGCTLCCSTVPVEEIGLGAFTRCPKLRYAIDARGPGCSIYPTRPNSCKAWNCQWLAEEDWPDELRPDRCGVVVDILSDLIQVDGREMPALQMWAAPGFEMAFAKQPVWAVVMAVINQKHAVIWRWADANGKQTCRGLFADPVTGQLIATAETPPDLKYAKRVPTSERMRRAQAIIKETMGGQSPQPARRAPRR